MSHYDPERDINQRFTDQVERWLDDHGEVFVVLRYLASAGSRDYCICQSYVEFLRLVEIVPEGTDIVVFKHKQLSLRGLCSPAFIEEALRTVKDGTEYLLVSTTSASKRDPRQQGREGDTHSDLQSDLMDYLGHQVALGAFPPFHGGDNEFMISASKGGIDGPR